MATRGTGKHIGVYKESDVPDVILAHLYGQLDDGDEATITMFHIEREDYPYIPEGPPKLPANSLYRKIGDRVYCIAGRDYLRLHP